MAVKPPGKLVKSKSQELILDCAADRIMEPSSPSNAFTSKMRKVFQSSPIMKKKRTISCNTTIGTSKAFGVPLIQLLGIQPQNDHRKLSLPVGPHSLSNVVQRKIPSVVVKIVDHIETHGLDQEGIYRINGNNKLVEKLRITFNEAGDADLTDCDIYSIGSVLKLFLRLLPTPLVPDDVSHKVIELQESLEGSPYSDDTIAKLKDILTELPSENHRLLKYLCDHLSLVAQHTDVNKMTSVSLSIVFGPNVFRCGGELIDLKNQGFANAAFAYMIQNHNTLFVNDLKNIVEEDNELKAVSTTSDEVFISTDNITKKPKEKPTRPKPYHEHKQLKSSLQTTVGSQGSISLPNSPVHAITSDVSISNDPVSPSSERSIDEAILEHEMAEEERKKQTQTTSTNSVSKLVRKKSLSDDVLLTNRGHSPSSWKTSPNTSPSSSPVVTPRTSQAYTTLLGDSIQDNLFTSTEDSHNLVSSEDGCTSTTDNTEVPYHVLPSSSEATTTTESIKSAQSNESIQSRETNFRRRTNTKRNNRRSAVYGSDSSLDTTGDAITTGTTKDELIHLLTVDEGVAHMQVSLITNTKSDENIDGKEEPRRTTKSIRDDFEKKGLLLKFPGMGPPIKPSKEEPSDDTLLNETVKRPPPPQVAKKPQRKSTDDQKLRNYVAHDFDLVTEKVKTLTHMTKQRVRGPQNRAMPSRTRSSSLTNYSSTEQSIADETRVTISSSVDTIDSALPSVTVHIPSSNSIVTTSINQTSSSVSADDLTTVVTSKVNDTVPNPAKVSVTDSTVPSVTPPVPQITVTSVPQVTAPLITQVTAPQVTATPVPQVTATPVSQVTATSPFVPQVTAPLITQVTVPQVMATPVPQVTATPPITQMMATPVSQVTATSPSVPQVMTPLITQVTAPQVTTTLPSNSVPQVTANPPVSQLTTTPVFQVTATSPSVPQVTAPLITPVTAPPVMATPNTQVTATPSVPQVVAPLITQVTVPQMTATPVPQVMVTPAPQVIATSVPQVMATPVPQVTATPVPQVMATHVPQMTATPVPQVTATPVPQVMATHVPQVTATPVPQVMATPSVPQVTATSQSTLVSAVRTIASTITTSSRNSTSIMSPSHDKSSSSTTTHSSPFHITQQVGPIDHNISMVPAGWTTDCNETTEYSYQELITEAKRLKQTITSFYEDFVAKNGRKPNATESSSISALTSSLTVVKKNLRELRSKRRELLNKTAPPQLTTKAVTDTIHIEEPLASLSAVRMDESLSNVDKKTDSTIRRHQSLSISSSHSKNSTFSLLIQSLQNHLDVKRKQAGRPEELQAMSYDQLIQEKHLIQKTLLQFEKNHGRPQSSDGKTIMKPLYNRYRDIKKILSSQENPDGGQNIMSPATPSDKSLWQVTMLPTTPSGPYTPATPTGSYTPATCTPTGSYTPAATPSGPYTPAIPSGSNIPATPPPPSYSSLSVTKEADHQPITYESITTTQQAPPQTPPPPRPPPPRSPSPSRSPPPPRPPPPDSPPRSPSPSRSPPPPRPPPPTSEAVLIAKRGRFKSATMFTADGRSNDLVTLVTKKKMYSKSASTSQMPSLPTNWMNEEELSTASLAQLHGQLLMTQTKKKEQRLQLRSFEIGFEEKEKRPVQNADKKKLMHTEYTQYKMLKNRISLLEVLLSKQKLQTTF